MEAWYLMETARMKRRCQLEGMESHRQGEETGKRLEMDKWKGLGLADR